MDLNIEKSGIHHIGFIVKDLDVSLEHFKNFYKLEDYQLYNFKPSRAWSYGEEVHNYELKIAMSQSKANRVGIELIQPISGKGVHNDFLLAGGTGLHHICISVDKEYGNWREKFVQEGYRFVFESETEDEIIGYRRCFYAEDPIAGMIIEVKENPYFRK